jgi:hypothetical protein
MADDKPPIVVIAKAIQFKGLDDLLSNPDANERDWTLLALSVSHGSRPSRLRLGAGEQKRLKERADDIAVRKLRELLFQSAMPDDWRAILSGWLNTHLRATQGRPQTAAGLKLIVETAVNIIIKKNPDRLIKEIRGEAARELGISDERVKQLDPTAENDFAIFEKRVI